MSIRIDSANRAPLPQLPLRTHVSRFLEREYGLGARTTTIVDDKTGLKAANKINKILEDAIELLAAYCHQVSNDQLGFLYNFYNENDFTKIERSSLPKDLIKKMRPIVLQYQAASAHLKDLFGPAKAQQIRWDLEGDYFNRQESILLPRVETALSECAANLMPMRVYSRQLADRKQKLENEILDLNRNVEMAVGAEKEGLDAMMKQRKEELVEIKILHRSCRDKMKPIARESLALRSLFEQMADPEQIEAFNQSFSRP